MATSLDVALNGPALEPAFTDPLPAGAVTFRVSTPDEQGHKWGIVRLVDGTDIDYLVDCLDKSRSWDPAVNSLPRKEVARVADFVGGVTIYPSHGQAELTVALTAGTYHFIDYDYIGDEKFTRDVPSLRITGTSAVAGLPVTPDAVIEAVANGDGETYRMPDTLPANGTLLLRNLTDHPQEAVIGQVVPDATTEDVLDFITAFRTGKVPQGKVFVGDPAGLMPVSGGRESAARFSLPPGRYAVCSYTSNPRTGRSGVFDGMLKLVTFA
ncbi:hypothetical protein [Kibdelosporangium phytohabitans]|uniref:Uncharacterized protein n=1 Tax=Kibdelosporangium phytohabitans TaxID=860235 RepID=A0A0N9I4D1_9PSEU|nr:hypothetical protein [Kibdelosporangium phytohabitans]ALG10921.1 hypothetical protein AOZ06_32140 [Kibdelosporangium phytohabitans]MBE1462112.1 hypothetical protein [Kibdelosporangium phytohabitans]